MPFLVDGDNFLGTSGRKRSDGEKRRLAAELLRAARSLGRTIVVVFDGNPPDRAGFAGDVHFAGSGASADDRILELLKSKRDRKGWIVVTSDRSLGDRCRWLEARVERSHEFRRRLGTALDGEKPAREEDVDYWLEQFGEIE